MTLQKAKAPAIIPSIVVGLGGTGVSMLRYIRLKLSSTGAVPGLIDMAGDPRVPVRTPLREDRDMVERDPYKKLIQMLEAERLAEIAARERVQIFGATGSGKTSGSGAALARAYLRAGFRELVLHDESDGREAANRRMGESAGVWKDYDQIRNSLLLERVQMAEGNLPHASFAEALDAFSKAYEAQAAREFAERLYALLAEGCEVEQALHRARSDKSSSERPGQQLYGWLRLSLQDDVASLPWEYLYRQPLLMTMVAQMLAPKTDERLEPARELYKQLFDWCWDTSSSVIHRDIKPGNVFVRDAAGVHLTDRGLGRYHVLHIACHGLRETSAVLPLDLGDRDWSGVELTSNSFGHGARLCILSACQSAVSRGSADTLTGVFVLGSPGSGKSSFVLRGLLPAQDMWQQEMSSFALEIREAFRKINFIDTIRCELARRGISVPGSRLISHFLKELSWTEGENPSIESKTVIDGMMLRYARLNDVAMFRIVTGSREFRWLDDLLGSDALRKMFRVTGQGSIRVSGRPDSNDGVRKGSSDGGHILPKDHPSDLGGDNGDDDHNLPVDIEYFDDDRLTTIDGFVIVDRRRAFITLRKALDDKDRERGIRIMIEYARAHSDMGVYYWVAAPESERYFDDEDWDDPEFDDKNTADMQIDGDYDAADRDPYGDADTDGNGDEHA